jgi:hypothetical protein
MTAQHIQVHPGFQNRLCPKLVDRVLGSAAGLFWNRRFSGTRPFIHMETGLKKEGKSDGQCL